MNRNQMMTDLRFLMEDAAFPWAVCGGYALDLFLDKDTRLHGDLDLCVFEAHRDDVVRYMRTLGWNVYEFRGQGKVRPLTDHLSSDSGRNLMCFTDDCDLVAFYPCEEEGMLYHQFFHTGIKSLCYLEFLFCAEKDDRYVFDAQKGLSRELSKAILMRAHTHCLAPEIALLYKASNADNSDYQYDFEQTYPHLNDEQRMWFSNGLSVLYPNGHPWNANALS